MGSHLDTTIKNTKSGFAKLESNNNISLVKSVLTVVEVPPGCVILFPQQILHEVLNKKLDHTSFRLFTGWKIGPKTRNMPFSYYSNKVFDDMTVVNLPGGGEPRVYSDYHGSVYLKKPFEVVQSKEKISTVEWMKKVFKPIAFEGEVVPKTMKSLKEMGFGSVYPTYTPEEKEMYTGVRLDSIYNIPEKREYVGNIFFDDSVFFLDERYFFSNLIKVMLRLWILLSLEDLCGLRTCFSVLFA